MKKNKINNEKVKALLSLLDDPDRLVYDGVKNELLNAEFSIISDLQNALHLSDDALKSDRLAHILDRIKLEKLTVDIETWRKGDAPDLLEGMLHIARYGYPNLDREAVTSLIDRMVASVKSKIEEKSPKEIAAVLNDVILVEFGFGGNQQEYSALNNSFINKVIEMRVSNPIGLSILYLLVAQKTNIPLVGINSPGHFILGYLDVDQSDKEELCDKVAFFIDPFHNGATIKNDDFLHWLKSQALPQVVLDTLMATEKVIVKRVFNNLIYALYNSGEKTTAEKLLVVAKSL